MHYPQPKMNQKSPNDPKSILILTIKLLYTYFWKTLLLLEDAAYRCFDLARWFGSFEPKSCNPPQIT